MTGTKIEAQAKIERIRDPWMWVYVAFEFGVMIALPLVIAIFVVRRYFTGGQLKVAFPIGLLFAILISACLIGYKIRKLSR